MDKIYYSPAGKLRNPTDTKDKKQADSGRKKKQCSWYDSDCHDMTYLEVIICKTDAFKIFKGGIADGICPILE